MTSINFKANYIQPAYIKDARGTKKETSFVELDVTDKNDMNTLKQITNKWKDSLVDLVYEDATDSEFLNNLENNHIYAISTQNKDFDKLNPDKIMGVTEFIEHGNHNEVELLQANPETNYEVGTMHHREYSGIGTGILDTLKELYPTKPMKVKSVSSAINFYKKNGFKKIDSDPTSKIFFWNV